eukprot:gb/GECH01014664.1/.p1 GENE.gb/GECH01014664.1/~~gb/GECH01014664.1/.p1  ORF type:complete len:200 (+),score=32.68 gb/GECH01014664.1/:1-600(+)
MEKIQTIPKEQRNENNSSRPTIILIVLVAVLSILIGFLLWIKIRQETDQKETKFNMLEDRVAEKIKAMVEHHEKLQDNVFDRWEKFQKENEQAMQKLNDKLTAKVSKLNHSLIEVEKELNRIQKDSPKEDQIIKLNKTELAQMKEEIERNVIKSFQSKQSNQTKKGTTSDGTMNHFDYRLLWSCVFLCLFISMTVDGFP